MAEARRIRVTRIPILREEEAALERIHRDELAGQPTRLGRDKLDVLADRRVIYVVQARPPRRLPRARLTLAGAVLLGVDPGNRGQR